jgi:Ca-activated chloride channel family protein
VPDVLADRPAVVFGKWKGEARGTITCAANPAPEIRAAVDVEQRQPVEGTARSLSLGAQPHRDSFGDYNQLERRRAGERRSRTSAHLQPADRYTSFVAVDTWCATPARTQQHVKQPARLPQGVENTAVGAGVPAVPEPETWALMIVGAAILAFKAYRARKARCA